MLVKNPPLDRMAMLVEYMQPVASEFIVVDTGSTKDELAVMRSWLNVKVLEREWQDDFSAARNEGLSECSSKWTVVLDPDELPSFELMKWFEQQLLDPNRESPIAYQIWTRNFWGGLKGVEEEYHWHIRVFRTGRGRFYRPVHELVALDGQPESNTRGMQAIKLPVRMHLIHSKSMPDMEQANALYRRLGEESR